MHPATEQILRYFDYAHLEGDLRTVSMKFHLLAHELVTPVDKGGMGLDGPEATVGLRKLLEAKDCAVRAALTSSA